MTLELLNLAVEILWVYGFHDNSVSSRSSGNDSANSGMINNFRKVTKITEV